LTRVVLDASVLLSATVGRPESPPSLLLDGVRSGEIEMVACEQLLTEVRDGLASPYFQDRLTDREGAAFVAMLRTLAVILADPISPPPVLRDPSDDYLVALAKAASADAIITGDRDLLDHPGLEPPAHTARQGCALLGLIDPEPPT
jgi:putative PIN family toxin of toxin-antitoxin system